MVFGLFEGNKIILECDKKAYKVGDTINCTVTLKLKKPVEAKGIKMQYAKLVGRNYEPMPIDEKETKEKRIYNDGEKFTFAFIIAEGLAAKKAGGVLGAMQGMAANMSVVSGYMIVATLQSSGLGVTETISLDTDPPTGFSRF